MMCEISRSPTGTPPASSDGHKAHDPAGFYATALSATRRAIKASGDVCDFWYKIAGFNVRVRFASAALATRLTPALSHLATHPTTAALTIYAWDTASIGISMPPPPWSEDDYLPRAEIRGFNNHRFRTAFDVYGAALRILDRERSEAIFWAQDAARLPGYEVGAPFRMLLHWWMSGHNRLLVHAAALGTPCAGVLLAGKSGSGKSTTAAACLNSELLYAADDYCLITPGPTPRVHSLYNTVKLYADTLQERAPHLATHSPGADFLDDRGKAIIFLHRRFAHKLTTEFPVKAILLPVVSSCAETRLRPATPIAALQALAPSTIMQLAGAGPQEFQRLANLVTQLPAYHLELGAQQDQIPRVIHNLLQGAG